MRYKGKKENMSKENINKISITGTIVETRLKDGIATKGDNVGKHYISGEIIIKSILDGVENLFPVSLYSFEVTADKQPSKLYASYKSIMENGIGRRVTINGSLQENRFWSAKKAEILTSQRISGRFINDAKSGVADNAIFEFSGFVGRNLLEKKNKDGITYLYELTVGQANYKGTSANLFRFNVDPKESAIVKIISEKYTAGTTIHINGKMRFITVQHTFQNEEENEKTLFGDKPVVTSVLTNKYFYIAHGDEPITGDTAYTVDDIKAYKDAIAAHDIEIQAKAKSNGENASSDEALSGMASSLI
jgi:hypothetical protein